MRQSEDRVKLRELELSFIDYYDLLGIEEVRINLNCSLICHGTPVQYWCLFFYTFFDRFIEHLVKLIIILDKHLEDLHFLLAQNTISACFNKDINLIKFYNSCFAVMWKVTGRVVDFSRHYQDPLWEKNHLCLWLTNAYLPYYLSSDWKNRRSLRHLKMIPQWNCCCWLELMLVFFKP